MKKQPNDSLWPLLILLPPLLFWCCLKSFLTGRRTSPDGPSSRVCSARSIFRFNHSANGAMKSAAPERRESCVYFFGPSSSVLSALPTAPSRGAITFTALSPPDGVFLTRRSDTERQFRDEKRLEFASRLAERCLAEGRMRGRGFRPDLHREGLDVFSGTAAD